MKMKTLEELRRRIKSVEDMQSVVATMKTLAAARIRQFETAANATQAYAQTIQLAFQVLMRDRNVRRNRFSDSNHTGITGLVILGSDQGFCGQFNESVTQAAIRFSKARGYDSSANQPIVMAVGARLNQLLHGEGYDVTKSIRLPNSVSRITTVTQRLIVEIEYWQKQHGTSHVELFFNLRQSASSYTVKQVQLLPLPTGYLDQLGDQPWSSRSRPTCPITLRKAFSLVIQQHLFLQLFRACAESLASENASRIAAMQKAESNIEERLDSLNTRFNQSRQRAITEELLDIISGVEAGTERPS